MSLIGLSTSSSMTTHASIAVGARRSIRCSTHPSFIPRRRSTRRIPRRLRCCSHPHQVAAFFKLVRTFLYDGGTAYGAVMHVYHPVAHNAHEGVTDEADLAPLQGSKHARDPRVPSSAMCGGRWMPTSAYFSRSFPARLRHCAATSGATTTTSSRYKSSATATRPSTISTST